MSGSTISSRSHADTGTLFGNIIASGKTSEAPPPGTTIGDSDGDEL